MGTGKRKKYSRLKKHATMSNNICGSGGTDQRERYSFANSPQDSKVQCAFINNYTLSKYGSKVSTYNAYNGVGNIRSNKYWIAHWGSILIRWGASNWESMAGIYSIIPDLDVSVFRAMTTGFRCAQ